jgi:hypothetical protein
MGCCEAIATDQQKLLLAKDLKLCIQSNNLSRLIVLSKWFSKGSLKSLSINTFRFSCLKGKSLNLPSYCLLLNNLEAFKMLHTSFKIDFELIEKILNEYDTSSMSEICKNNHFDFLQFYLPHYLQLDIQRLSVISHLTLDLRSRDNSKFKFEATPVQLACESNHIQILHYIYKYFESSPAPPALDIHFIDPATGENCALISCRTGNYSMMRFLLAVCGADFKVVNNKNESAVQVLASASKQRGTGDVLAGLRFLVEQAGVSLLHGYEETLLILENAECISWVEQQLAAKGVFTSKMEVEFQNRIIKRNSEEGGTREIVVEKNSLASSIEPANTRFSSLGSLVNLMNK